MPQVHRPAIAHVVTVCVGPVGPHPLYPQSFLSYLEVPLLVLLQLLDCGLDFLGDAPGLLLAVGDHILVQSLVAEMEHAVELSNEALNKNMITYRDRMLHFRHVPLALLLVLLFLRQSFVAALQLIGNGLQILLQAMEVEACCGSVLQSTSAVLSRMLTQGVERPQ